MDVETTAKRDLIPRLQRLPRGFYLRPTLRVAREILGSYLLRNIGSETLVGRIVEVEAYLGERDPASHAFRGRTRRNEVMFREGGHLYVYFTYGMHFCSNVVTEGEDTAHAVLLRAVEPIEGLPTMRRNRRLSDDAPATQLCSGPARLCQAFGITGKENGTDLCGDQIWLARKAGRKPHRAISVTTRVGISEGKEHRWRFFFTDDPFVSPGKPVL